MDNNKIDVMEFVNGYNECTTAKAKESYLKKLKVIDYVNYEVKIALAEKIVDSSSYDLVNRSSVRVNGPMRYILFVYTVLTYYTNLDTHSERMFEEFNVLNRYGLIDEIFKLVPDREIAEFNNVIAMTYDDFLTNYYEPHNFISNQLDKIGALAGNLPQDTLDRIADVTGRVLNESVEETR